jgi:hypothetical protein
MKAALKTPCNECPWRRNHPAGWLGGYEPEDFTQQVQFDGPPLPCHKTIPPGGEAKAMCAGALIFMKNSCKGANHPDYGNALDTVEQDTVHVFQWGSEFLAHHKDRAGWIARTKVKTEGRANG